ncbi:hypothetical protein Y032_0286g1415 [Ancylostoma ceylanicum]|nr:hypothetical protein Y032_0286g1415 [Ancylostoma ceylanicum]
MLFAYLFGVKSLYPDPTMYDCSAVDTINFYPNIGIGLLYLLPSVVTQIIYIPCIIVMTQPPLKSMFCFKIMTLMGVVDVLCLFICGDLAGIWQITGQTYCNSPTLAYITGNLSMGLWAVTTLSCVLLAFNRTFDLLFPHKTYIFDGKFFYIWLLFPTAHFIFLSFFERTLIYDPRELMFYFNPHTNVSRHLDPHVYEHIPHIINNGSLIISLSSFYPIICLSLAYRMWKKKSAKISTMTKQIILQSMVICGCHIVCCFLYVYIQFFTAPKILHVIANFTWIGNHGIPGVIYLCMNNTIRSRVFILLGIRKPSSKKAAITVTCISRMTRHTV